MKGDIDKDFGLHIQNWIQFEMQSLASFPQCNLEHYSAIYLRILKCTKTFHKRTDREEKEYDHIQMKCQAFV